jgi:cytolysin-activating lysine-acyltransferase
MTPALLQQFRTFYATDRPIGVVLWANVSDDVAERLAQGTTKLRPQDWKSGDKLWVMPEACVPHDEVIAPFGGAEEMVKDLKEKVFPTKPVHFLAVNKDGKQVRVL